VVDCFSRVLRAVLPQRFQRAAPSDDLVEYSIDRFLVPCVRLEKTLKVSKSVNMVAHRSRDHPMVRHRVAGSACSHPI